MSATPVVLTSFTFNSQKAFKDRIKEIQKHIPVPELEDRDSRYYRIINKEDIKLLHEVLERHPHREAKIKNGVADFAMRMNQINPRTMEFVIIGNNDEATEFSPTKAIHGPRPPEEFLQSALRQLVRPQTNKVKDNFFDGHHRRKCQSPSCGNVMTYDKADVDHKWPKTFKNLVHTWCAENSIAPGDIKYFDDENNTGQVVPSGKLRVSWSEYHEENAELQVICQKCNRGKNHHVE